MHNSAQKPSAAYDEELRLEMQSNAFALDYVIHANNGIRGSHCIELTLRQADIAWPFMNNLQLVWDIIKTYSHFLAVDFVSPLQFDTEKQAWCFVNVILENGQLVMISPECVTLHGAQTPQLSWYPTTLASWGRLRVGYDWGGRAEVALIVNCEAFRLAVASDMKLAAFQRGWVLRTHKLNLHEVIAPFNSSINWRSGVSESCHSSSGSNEFQESTSCVSSFTTLPSMTGPICAMQGTDTCQPIIQGRQGQRASISCSIFKIQLAMGTSALIHSMLQLTRGLMDNTPAKPRNDPALQLERQDPCTADRHSSDLPSAMLLVPATMYTQTCVGTTDKVWQPSEGHPCSTDFMQSCGPAMPDHWTSHTSSFHPIHTANFAAVVPKVYTSFNDPFIQGSLSTMYPCCSCDLNHTSM